MQTRAAPNFTDYGLLVLLAAFWGASFLLSKVAVQDVPPFTVTLWRQVVAALFFVAIFFIGGERQSYTRQDHINAFLTAILGTGIPFALITWGVVEVDASIAAIMMGLMPLAVLVMAHMTTDDEKMSWQKLVGVAIGFMGLIVLFWPDITGNDAAHGGSVWRYLAILGAAFCYAINALVTRRLSHLKPRPLYTLVMAWTVVTLLPLVLLTEDLSAGHYTFAATGSIVLLGIFPSAIASLMLFKIIARQGATFFGQINFLVPLFGVLWGALFLGERLTLYSGLALLFILGGIGFSRLDLSRLKGTKHVTHEQKELR